MFRPHRAIIRHILINCRYTQRDENNRIHVGGSVKSKLKQINKKINANKAVKIFARG